jgi:hypothetical protein
MSTKKRELEDDEESGSEFSEDGSVSPVAKKTKTTVTRKTPVKKSGNGLTKKDIDLKLKAASEGELKAFLKEILSTHGETLKESFDAFHPKLMPIAPTSKDDPLLTSCFRCQTTDDLQPIAECKICSRCSHDLLGSYGTMTRDRVVSNFNFTKGEADKITRKTTSGGMFNGKIYVYTLPAVLKAVTKKHGSLYMMLKAGGN